MESELETCIPGAFIHKNSHSLVIQYKNGLKTLGLCNVKGGMGKVENIVYSSLNSEGDNNRILEKIGLLIEDADFSTGTTGLLNGLDMDDLIINSHDKICIIAGFSAIKLEKITDTLEKIDPSTEFSPLDIILLVNQPLSDENLLQCFKTVIDSKYRALEKIGISRSRRTFNTPREDAVIIACPYYEDSKVNPSEITDIIPTILYSVEETCQQALRKSEVSLGILDYIEAQGITIDDLVDAGMELCVGVEVDSDLKLKLKNQILKSLEDLNVIALLMAAIRVEYDFENHRVREVNVDDDPAYLYTDEVLGIAISNQIAGTKATFNFKRYDEEKPGIISTLGPMVDDIFAGLVAGCMSKIFEE
ncbi:phosphatidylglycerophosphatase A [Methanobacterium alcaliphilum]|uniref:phosphatidylglycerophosphatase A n=1 Tax=Methanobacterium alcaliphilum TaxID=392018 RepID=UPI00200B9EA1|nr:phosphatidylglycerophosphatase A [Methanobacterium alcaliphilum]MCK9150560.1 phosphatidylglycerophosphatase A [Methanobacterium alcaliphilum]